LTKEKNVVINLENIFLLVVSRVKKYVFQAPQ